MSDPNGIQWGKVVLGMGAAMMVVAALVGAYTAGRRGDSRPAVLPVVQQAPSAMVPVPAQAPTVQPVPAAPSRPAAPTDAEIAQRLATLQGEELVGELWQIENLANPGITCAMLQRNAARHAGQIVVFTGEVLEIQDLPQGGSFVRLGLNYSGDHALAVFTYVEPSDEVVQGRRVRAYGALAGTFEYTSQAGWNISIPRMNAVAVVPNSVPRRAPRAARAPR